jgi:sec-independent protein translocase protein TatA
MLGNLSGIHLLVLVLVILLLFGAPKLPALARSMGQSMRIFRKEVHTLSDEAHADANSPASVHATASATGVPSQPDIAADRPERSSL